MRRKRTRGSSFRRAALTVFCAAALLLAVFYSGAFDVKHIYITGNEAVSEKEVIRLAGLTGSVSVLGVSARKAEGGLKASPFIAGASVTKTLPGTIIIKLTERRPCGYIENKPGGAFILVDDAGVALESSGFMRRKLPVIKGLPIGGFKLGESVTGSGGEAFAEVFEVVRLLKPYGLEDAVSAIDASDPDNIVLFAGQAAVSVGYGGLNRKIQDLKSILDSGGERFAAPCSLDMRYSQYVFRYER
jgi:hypothetical protein